MQIVDMHCDTISRLLETGETLRENTGHLDLEKMRKGRYLLQNFALFVNQKKTGDPWQAFEKLYEVYERELLANADILAPVLSYEDIAGNRTAGKLSALLTVEEGAVCGGSFEKLEELYRRGVRMMTLTWNYPNELGFPAFLSLKGEEGETGTPWWRRPQTEKGLTGTGLEFVDRMQQLGMIVDVSHLSDAGFYQVLRRAKKPFVASHSNARAVSPWVRNMTDDMIRSLAECGGVMGLNFCADFLTEVPAGTFNPGTMEAVADHAKHIAQVGGIEVLGLGSDFDGIDTNAGIPDAACMPALAELFHARGFTYGEVDKILGENVLRLYRDCL